MKKSKTKIKETKKKVSTQADALEAALDYIEKLQIDNYNLEEELANCELQLADKS